MKYAVTITDYTQGIRYDFQPRTGTKAEAEYLCKMEAFNYGYLNKKTKYTIESREVDE